MSERHAERWRLKLAAGVAVVALAVIGAAMLAVGGRAAPVI